MCFSVSRESFLEDAVFLDLKSQGRVGHRPKTSAAARFTPSRLSLPFSLLTGPGRLLAAGAATVLNLYQTVLSSPKICKRGLCYMTCRNMTGWKKF